MTAEQRVAPVALYRPELASFNAGSINFALFPVIPRYKEWKHDWEPKYLGMTEDFIFPNTFKSMRESCAKFAETGTKPEFEIYDAGMVNNVAFMIHEGCVKEPVYIRFVMGVLGGNARVSLEDNLFLEKGRMAKSNGEQVAKIVRIARELGIEPATPDEARDILHLKGIGRVNY